MTQVVLRNTHATLRKTFLHQICLLIWKLEPAEPLRLKWATFFFKPCNERRRSCKSQMNLLRKKTFVVSPWEVSQFQPSKSSCEFPGMGRSTAPGTLHGKCGLVFWDSEHQSYRVMVSKTFFFPLICGNDSHFDEHMFQRGWFNHQTRLSTICKTKIVPENGWLGDYTFVESACFQGLCLLVSGNVRKSFFVGWISMPSGISI